MISTDELRNWATVLTAIFAFSAFLWQLITYRRDTPHLTVEARWGRFRWTDDSPAIKVPVCEITVVSRGKDPPTLEACGLRFRNESPGIFRMTDETLPRKLRRYQKYVTRIPVEKDEMTKVLYAWAKDSTGREWRSKKRPFRRS
jgi:hypothetical protein